MRPVLTLWEAHTAKERGPGGASLCPELRPGAMAESADLTLQQEGLCEFLWIYVFYDFMHPATIRLFFSIRIIGIMNIAGILWVF